MISYSRRDGGRSQAEREAIAVAVVAEFLAGIRALERQAIAHLMLATAECRRLGFLRHLRDSGRLES